MLRRSATRRASRSPRAGGKGASLARMSALGLPVPPGFVVPADVPGRRAADGGAALRAALPDHERAQAIVAAAELPAAIAEAYAALGDDPPVAVRSSACAEDSETASYAGQQETYLHVRGADAVRRPRARLLGVVLLRARDLLPRRRRARSTTSAWRSSCSGWCAPTSPACCSRATPCAAAATAWSSRPCSGSARRRCPARSRPTTTCSSATARSARRRSPSSRSRSSRSRRAAPRSASSAREGGEQKLAEDQLRELARIGDDLEQRLGGPQDIEWALEGGEIFVLQARPVTT